MKRGSSKSRAKHVSHLAPRPTHHSSSTKSSLTKAFSAESVSHGPMKDNSCGVASVVLALVALCIAPPGAAPWGALILSIVAISLAMVQQPRNNNLWVKAGAVFGFLALIAGAVVNLIYLSILFG